MVPCPPPTVCSCWVWSAATREQACRELLALRPAVVRGNASEVLALGGEAGAVRGVDSTAAAADALDVARRLARRHGIVVAVSGAVDLVGR